MTIKRRSASSWPDAGFVKRWTGSAWVDAGFLRRWSGTAWVDVALPGGGSGDLSVSVSPGSAMVVVHNPNPDGPPAAVMQTNAVTATASGGSGSGPTYQWTRVEGVAGTPTNPTSAATAFSCTVYSNQPQTAVFRCRVTRGSETVDVFVNAYWEYVRGTIT